MKQAIIISTAIILAAVLHAELTKDIGRYQLANRTIIDTANGDTFIPQGKVLIDDGDGDNWFTEGVGYQKFGIIDRADGAKASESNKVSK